MWCHDQAGPYQTVPQAGSSWQAEGQPARQPAEYVRNGTAKLLTLFHPQDGHLKVKGVRSCPNRVLHPWLKEQLSAILERLPAATVEGDVGQTRAMWESWQAGLRVHFTLPDHLPTLRLLLILDNLKGHKTPDFVLWLVVHGIMPLYTPLGGSWLNMAESIQRIVVRRALAGQHPQTPEEIMTWLEAVAVSWNRAPTPFEWAGKRAARRLRSRQRRLALGGSGACIRRSVSHKLTKIQKWLRTSQLTH